MISLNRVFLTGNLCRDPELKQLPSGMPLCDLRLAVNETYRNPQTNETHETTHFVDVTVWDRQATNCNTYLKKGSPILVEGRLQYDEWKTPQGETRSKIRVRADRVQFFPRPASGDVPGGSGAPAHLSGAPSTPSTPSTPSAPSAPITPSAPSTPITPSAPGTPSPELTVDTEDLPF